LQTLSEGVKADTAHDVQSCETTMAQSSSKSFTKQS